MRPLLGDKKKNLDNYDSILTKKETFYHLKFCFTYHTEIKSYANATRGKRKFVARGQVFPLIVVYYFLLLLENK